MPELTGTYVRSISIINGDLYTASGPNAICKYQICPDHFEFMERYSVPESIAGMNQITRIGEFYCDKDDRCTFIASFYDYKDSMKDDYHYTQEGYNAIGEEAGIQAGLSSVQIQQSSEVSIH